MLNKIQKFFKDVFEDSSVEHDTISLDIACAVLLVEVMKADGLLAEEEQVHIATVLTKHFPLSPIEVDDLIEQAMALSDNANDFYQFTSVLNKHYKIEEKIQIVELLWQLALADGNIAAIEQHVIRKIADLLHLRQGEFINAKVNAQKAFEQKR